MPKEKSAEDDFCAAFMLSNAFCKCTKARQSDEITSCLLFYYHLWWVELMWCFLFNSFIKYFHCISYHEGSKIS